MKKYLGVKEIMATPMTRGDYNTYRGWKLPKDEDGSDEGFLVEYVDGGKANHPNHEGYISWSPTPVFHKAYRETTGMPFGLAIEAAKKGLKIARGGWNGKGMWLQLVEMDYYSVLPEKVDCVKTGPEWNLLPWLGMKTADGNFVPWLASQTDVLAEDWVIVE